MGFKSFSTADFLHNLLSATHPDTVPASPVTGDLIFGNATPAWQRLPVGTNGYVLGVTSGVPTWMPAPSIGEVSLFFTDAASDIGGYKALSTTLPPEAIATVGASIGGAGVAIEEWASPTSFHTPVFVPSGTWTSHVHVQRTAGGGQAQVFAGLYRRTHPGAVETLLGTMGPFNVDDNNVHEEDIDVSLPDTIFATTDRLVLKYYANKVVGSGSDPTVTLSYRGDTGSRLDFPVSTTSLDHGLLAGLADDDHLQYALLAGRAGGQTLNGGSAASETLTLHSTADATKGKIILGATSAFNEATDSLGIGTNDPLRQLHLARTSGTVAAFHGTSANDGDSVVVSGRMNTTGAGAANFVEAAAFSFIFTTHDHATRAADIAFFTASAGSATERLRIKSTGVVNAPGLPTSAAGLAANDLWVDTTGGLNIVKRV